MLPEIHRLHVGSIHRSIYILPDFTSMPMGIGEFKLLEREERRCKRLLMLLKDSILLDTFPMSPEPKQEVVNENWNAANLNTGVRVTSDSESEDEDHPTDGYMPLSQEPVDGDLLLDEEEEDEWVAAPVNPPQIVPESSSQQIQITSETIQVWTSSCNRSNIDLDADKIDQVKNVMASFFLPNTAIPEWANTVTEEQWKEQLMGRIKEMQSK